MAREWFEKRERGSARLLNIARRLVLLMGRRSAGALLWAITVYYYTVLGDGRRALYRYYEALWARKPTRRTIFHHYLMFARTILDRVYFLARRADAPRYEVCGFEAVTQHLERGQGCVLLGAHLGSFEAARIAASCRPDLKMQVIMDAQVSRKLNAALAVLHPGAHDSIVSLGTPTSLLRVKETIEQAGLVGIMGDRALAGEATYTRPFLGRNAIFPLGPLRLAATLRAPVFFFAALYRTAIDGSRYYEVVFEPLSAPAMGGCDRALWIDDLGERYTAALQKYCRIAPDNWFNFYDFWYSQTSCSSNLDVPAKPPSARGGAPMDCVHATADARPHGKS